MFFFIEYVPVCKADLCLCLTEKQKERISLRINNLRLIFPSLFLSLPGDEDQYGGCLASGRGFVHVSSTGNLEPCPFAPYSDTNLAKISLKEGLESDFLRTVRENHSELTETKGGCTLWTNKDWVEDQLQENTPSRLLNSTPELTEAI